MPPKAVMAPLLKDFLFLINLPLITGIYYFIPSIFRIGYSYHVRIT